MNDQSYSAWFNDLAGHAQPHRWQCDLASSSDFCDRLIRIPTGLGKTQGILSAWSYHRICRKDPGWPRKLIWCLPMRVLVEQTRYVADELINKMPLEDRPTVHVAMGGEDGGEWFLDLERHAVIIGTQDMLLSRALNRGFASTRARWPMEFGLLNQDALWVMDEVQLMDVGLATSAQLQAFRARDREKELRPCRTWWMSATLQPEWLKSVDTEPYHARWQNATSRIAASGRSGGLWGIRKSLATETIQPKKAAEFAARILALHTAAPESHYGRITLVVCNTVERACETFDELRKKGRTKDLELVHSRFRPAERDGSAERVGWREAFLNRKACVPGVDRIIVATQVVEAGVDISATTLVTELAPWPSLVQRFGRCARYGGEGAVVVVDRGRDESGALPYAAAELESAWVALEKLAKTGVGVAALEAFEDALDADGRARLYPYAPEHLLLPQEFEELFDTTPDLTGADLDISRFIRSDEERDLHVFWLDLPKEEEPESDRQPNRIELCAVPFLKAREWLCGDEKKPKLKPKFRAWVWDWIDGEWVTAKRESLVPGRIVCVAADCGGYRRERGFDPNEKGKVYTEAAWGIIPTDKKALAAADNRQNGESLSEESWKTIACHTSEVAEKTVEIATALALPAPLRDALVQAAWWHDWGKAHPAFQGALKGTDRPDRNDLAKGPKAAWRQPPDIYKVRGGNEVRPAFRHELASALGLFALLRAHAPQHPALTGPWAAVLAPATPSAAAAAPVPPPSPLVQRLLDCTQEAFDLLVYLVASHHGKVRVALHAAPADQEYRATDGNGLPIRGIRENDRLPSVALKPGEPAVPEVSLSLSPASIGISEGTGASWRERSQGVLDRFGPCALAFLEALLRAADIRASRLTTGDPALPAQNREARG